MSVGSLPRSSSLSSFSAALGFFKGLALPAEQ